MLKKLSICFMLLTLSISAFAAQWSTNYTKTLSEAKKSNKKVLILFTGSDWCGFCIRLEKNVLSTKKFAKQVKDNYLLVKLDLTRKKVNPIEAEINYLVRAYGVEGFPTTIILDPNGKELKRVVGAPKDYLQKIK